MLQIHSCIYTLITAIKHAVFSFYVNRNDTVDIEIKRYHLTDPVMIAGGNTMDKITIIHKKEDLEIIKNRSNVYEYGRGICRFCIIVLCRPIFLVYLNLTNPNVQKKKKKNSIQQSYQDRSALP
jgi:hypothetical protein